jgi:hypothetical protein
MNLEDEGMRGGGMGIEWFIIVVFLILGTLGLASVAGNLDLTTIDRTLSHAEKHPDADTVRNCMDNGSSPKWRIIIRDSKYVDVCDMGAGLFGFQPFLKYGGNGLTSKWSELTAYVREEIKSSADLVKFAADNSWELLRMR